LLWNAKTLGGSHTRQAPQPGRWSYRGHGRYHHYSKLNQFLVR
jgi:hypothetical protein